MQKFLHLLLDIRVSVPSDLVSLVVKTQHGPFKESSTQNKITILTDRHDWISHGCRARHKVSDQRGSVIHPVWEDRNRLRGVLLVVSVS